MGSIKNNLRFMGAKVVKKQDIWLYFFLLWIFYNLNICLHYKKANNLNFINQDFRGLYLLKFLKCGFNWFVSLKK